MQPNERKSVSAFAVFHRTQRLVPPRASTRVLAALAVSMTLAACGAIGQKRADEPVASAPAKHGSSDAKRTAFTQTGTASWYGRELHGRKTASGDVFDMNGMTAAHRTLPLPSYVRVTNLENGRTVILRINDRGPFVGDRIIDVSAAAATKLGFAARGVAKVKVETVAPPAETVSSLRAPAAR